MKHTRVLLAAMTVAVLIGGAVIAQDPDSQSRRIAAVLRGIEEPPSISSTGTGMFRATIAPDASSISYTLSYADLEGDVLQAHIHLGQRGVNGGIAVFLCSNLGNGPAGTQLCPGPRAGTISGTFTGADIVGPAAQGLTAAEFTELVRAIDRSVTYVNVHTSKHTGGEIRGQVAGQINIAPTAPAPTAPPD
ncbi:MAG TPA: CHRD domain-containing protein [Candidatus Polarisedimenticolia bacterium]|nr:CHRD domain-containing protein [Candidatus Polarisedimenticolia bacterium]